MNMYDMLNGYESNITGMYHDISERLQAAKEGVEQGFSMLESYLAGPQLVPAYAEYQGVMLYSGHTKNKSKSNQEKHQRGDERRIKDQGGEKKDQKSGWKDRSGNRR